MLSPSWHTIKPSLTSLGSPLSHPSYAPQRAFSDLSAYVSGQTLAVDGGFTAVGPIDYTANLPLVDVSGPGGTIGLQ